MLGVRDFTMHMPPGRPDYCSVTLRDILCPQNDIGNTWYVSDMKLEYDGAGDRFPEAKPSEYNDDPPEIKLVSTTIESKARAHYCHW